MNVKPTLKDYARHFRATHKLFKAQAPMHFGIEEYERTLTDPLTFDKYIVMSGIKWSHVNSKSVGIYSESHTLLS